MVSKWALYGFGGEVNPTLYGRRDIPKVMASSRLVKNGIFTVERSLYKRGGTVWVSNTLLPQKPLLIPFIYNSRDYYTIVLEDGKMWFIRNGKPLLDDDGDLLVLDSIYSQGDFYDENNIKNISVVQRGNDVRFYHGKYNPLILTRTGENKFILNNIDFKGYEPFDDMNADNNIRVYSSGETGDVTLTSNSPIFTAEQNGSLFCIFYTNHEELYSWTANRTVTAGMHIINDSKIYYAPSAGTTGNTPPTHTEGTVSDGSVDWTYLNSGYGIARITSVGSDGLTAQATVLGESIPWMAVGESKATWKWKFGSWSSVKGYPTSAILNRERLAAAWGNDRIAYSWVGYYDDFGERDYGKLTAETGFSFSINSGSNQGQITSLASDQDLVVGTTTQIMTIAEQNVNDIFSVGNVRSYPQLELSCSRVPMMKFDNQIVFFNGMRKNATALMLQANYRYSPVALSDYAKHLLVEGVVRCESLGETMPQIFCLKENGVIASLLYDIENKSLDWGRIEIGGEDATIEDICADGQNLVMCIKRQVNGSDVYSIEIMSHPFEGYLIKDVSDFGTQDEYQSWRNEQLSEVQDTIISIDCASVIELSEPSTIVNGLDNYAGNTVSILADGQKNNLAQVTYDDENGWHVTLDFEAKNTVVLGYPFKFCIIPTAIEASYSGQASMFTPRRVNKIGVMAYNTLGLKYGSTMDRLYDFDVRPDNINIDAPVPLNSDLMPMTMFDGGYTINEQVIIYSDNPFPVCLQALVYEFEVSS